MKAWDVVMSHIQFLEIHEAGPGEHVYGEAPEAVVTHVEDLGPDVHVVRDHGSPRAPALHCHLAWLPETTTRGGAEGGAQALLGEGGNGQQTEGEARHSEGWGRVTVSSWLMSSHRLVTLPACARLPGLITTDTMLHSPHSPHSAPGRAPDSGRRWLVARPVSARVNSGVIRTSSSSN